MENQRHVHINELQGYRQPTAYEVSRMAEYMRRDNKIANVVFLAFEIAMFFFALMLLLNLILFLGTESTVSILLKLVFAFLLAGGGIFMHGAARGHRIETQMVRRGDFQVLDCLIWHAEQDLNSTNMAVVKIYHDGSYCDNWLQLNLASLALWTENKQYPAVLLKCQYHSSRDRTRYELFTESKLSERLD